MNCDLKRLIKSKGFEVLENQSMSEFTTFRIGGPADLIVINSVTDLIKVVQVLHEKNQPFFVLGRGSNLLVSDDGIDLPVLLFSQNFSECRIVDSECIYAQAGARLSSVAEFSAKNSLSGMEFAYGIPGSIGGAITMNAGAYGGEMKDIVESVDVLEGERFHTIPANEMDFGYRHSCIRNGIIVCGVKLKLEKAEETKIREKMADFQKRRIEKQPLQYPSAGSVFKRPTGYFAGQLIQEAGLKGHRIGGAMVSEKHAGFIINVDHATCKDVIMLIEYIQKTVFQKTNIWLENEIRPVGVGIK